MYFDSFNDGGLLGLVCNNRLSCNVNNDFVFRVFAFKPYFHMLGVFDFVDVLSTTLSRISTLSVLICNYAKYFNRLWHVLTLVNTVSI